MRFCPFISCRVPIFASTVLPFLTAVSKQNKKPMTWHVMTCKLPFLNIYIFFFVKLCWAHNFYIVSVQVYNKYWPIPFISFKSS